MSAAVVKVRRIRVPVRVVVGVGHVVGQRCADSYFDSLECIQDQQSQCSVEDVKIEYIIERCSITEEMIWPGLLEGDRVRRQSVIADVL